MGEELAFRFRLTRTGAVLMVLPVAVPRTDGAQACSREGTGQGVRR